MEIRNVLLVSSVLVIWIISGNLAHTYVSGRAAKILEDPIVPQDWNHETSRENIVLRDKSDRSLTIENNMMLYRSVFTLSLKLLSVFLIIKLFSYGAGLVRQKGHPVAPLHQQLLYTVDVNHNPIPTTLVTQASNSVATGTQAGAAVAGVPVIPQAVPAGGYISPMATNPRPSFLLPRFRFGGPRHPPVRPRYPHPPPNMMGPGGVTHHNMGEETHFVETHSHVYVHPDGSQTRVQLPTTVVQNTVQKPTSTGSSQATAQNSGTKNAKPDSASAASSTSDVTTESVAAAASSVESVSISTSSSSSTSAERRSSSPVFREKYQPLHHQQYEDWNHFNPGTR